MAKSKKKTPKDKSKLPTIELDPVLPLPAGTGIPPVKQGEGKEILANDSIRVIELPYRAFYFLWEIAERRAAENYGKYVGTQLDDAAQAYLEAVYAFRNVDHQASTMTSENLPIFTEAEAKKIRARLAKIQKAEAEAAKAARKRKGTPDTPDSQEPVDEAAQADHQHEIVRKKSKKTGDRYWMCSSCGERFSSDPSEAPQRKKKNTPKKKTKKK